jgi:Flp pilus assembly protein TadG
VRRLRERREQGQSLVEFSMIVPLFLLLLLGLLEMGFAFDHLITLSYASREGARTGAALATGSKLADCTQVDEYVVSSVQRVLDSPGSPVAGHLADVTEIRIYRADAAGNATSAANVWTPGSGPSVDGEPLQFTESSHAWASCTRSNATSNPDSIGVSVSYTYRAVTPLASLLRLFGGPGWATLPMSDRTVMALNPTD